MPEGPIRAEELSLRPVERDEVARFNACLDEHHWLGHRLVGETMRYVASIQDRWVALVGFGSAALACGPRDAWVGWSPELQFRRLRYIVNNQRFCVLPDARRPNLASAVLARATRAVSGDYQAAYGHPVLVVETFTDPARHQGTCYRAAGFSALGTTLGYGRSGGRYVHHGAPKLLWAREVLPGAASILASPFDHPLLSSPRRFPVLDLNTVSLDGDDGLLAAMASIPDHRKARGIRHKLASVLAVAAAAVLSGARSFVAIGEWAAEAPQEVLARLGCRRSPASGAHQAPDEATLRRVLQRLDADALDLAIGRWLEAQVRAGCIDADALAVAVDGKTLRGAVQADGRAVHLFAAMVHREGAVLAQRDVGHKDNEITEFRPLLEPLDLVGKVVTADAMHTQRDHAGFLTKEKGADYLFTVKANQPSLLDAAQALPLSAFSPPVGGA
jgi:hypothetical protein